MNDDHSKYHSANAFCGNAGAEEMKHLMSLVSSLSDSELEQLVIKLGIYQEGANLDRDEYERVIDEADREDFYREYHNIILARKK